MIEIRNPCTNGPLSSVGQKRTVIGDADGHAPGDSLMKRMTAMLPMWIPAAQMRLVNQVARIAIDSQVVIGMRMAGMMGMIAQAPGEPFRMVAEKQAAAQESLFAMAEAGFRGGSPESIFGAGLGPYGRRTRANSRRLTKVRASR